MSVALKTSDRAIPLGPGARPAPSASPTPKSDGGAALKEAAGIAGTALVVGTIIYEFLEQAKCNTPVPRPFERGTLNAELMRKPVVRRTCERADWYLRDRQGNDVTIQDFIASNSRSVGSVLDPPQQVDGNAHKADSAADPEVRRIIGALDNILASRGGTGITNYGKFRYKPVGERTDEVWVNLVGLDFSRATISTQSGVSAMTVPCLHDYDCALYLLRREGHIKVFPTIRFYLQGQGTWQAVLAEIDKLKVIFPKQPVVQAN